MTDRIHSLTVVLKRDMRDDDAQPLMDAIGMLRGVLSVEGHVSDIDSTMSEARAQAEMRHKVFSALGLLPSPEEER